ncbi:hypothetical protein J3459_014854 [Metarhizium acridum]|nr:hypothetical protein J3459_014854 [Metarhizium acridum]
MVCIYTVGYSESKQGNHGAMPQGYLIMHEWTTIFHSWYAETEHGHCRGICAFDMRLGSSQHNILLSAFILAEYPVLLRLSTPTSSPASTATPQPIPAPSTPA